MSFTFIFECHTRDDAVDEVKRLLAEILDDTRSFEGCEGVRVLQDQEEPTKILLVEEWASKDDQQRYGAWRGERGDMAPIFELLVDRSRRFLDDTGI